MILPQFLQWVLHRDVLIFVLFSTKLHLCIREFFTNKQLFSFLLTDRQVVFRSNWHVFLQFYYSSTQKSIQNWSRMSFSLDQEMNPDYEILVSPEYFSPNGSDSRSGTFLTSGSIFCSNLNPESWLHSSNFRWLQQFLSHFENSPCFLTNI